VVPAALDGAVREAGARIVAALATRYRDLDLAEEAHAEACARAAAAWGAAGVPSDPAGWLYRTADRCAVDILRRQNVRRRLQLEPPLAPLTPEQAMIQASPIPDERLRLIFVCCHPAIAAEARAALTLRLVCGLSTTEIARAFLLSDAALQQRLVRAKRKIAQAGIPFEVPGPQRWPERMDAVLSTLEVIYSKAHEDAAGAGPHAGYAAEVLALTALLCRLAPGSAQAAALAASIRFTEARRPARCGPEGAMVPLSEQDPALWLKPLIADGEAYLAQAAQLGGGGPRLIQAAINGTWCARRTAAEPAPWPRVLALYDRLLEERDDPVVRLNRAVAVAQVHGAQSALAEIERLEGPGLGAFLPYHAVRADLLARLGRVTEAREAYAAALALGPGAAERIWLSRQRAALA
jgi:RNA polymerase sigma-70 factor (ECF subfamily)